jgi:uncharacterized protein YbjT (DUF2867 family)
MSSAVVFGGTGLVGNYLIKTLINDEYYSKVKVFTRSEINITNTKLEIINTNFDNLEEVKNLILADSCFFCIGTTKKNSSNKDDYQKVELELPKKIAQICKNNLIKSFIFVSSGFADPKNKGEYLRFKGLVEEELKRLDFDNLGILRPSFLLGERKQFRIAEKIGIPIFTLLTPLFIGPLKKLRPIHANTVANAMSNIVKKNLNQITYESDEIVKIS